MSEWRQNFNDRSEDTEDMYQAFKDRYEAEQEGDTLEYDKHELEEMKKQRDIEEHYSNYESTEYYREQYAIKKGYVFKPKIYDPDEKYQGKRL